MKRYAAGPKSPIPPREGNDVGCNRMPAARAKDMSPPLHSLFSTGASQSLVLFLIPLDLAGLGHLIHQGRNKQAEAFLLLALQKSITNLIPLGGEVRVRRLLILEDRQHGRIRTAIDRP